MNTIKISIIGLIKETKPLKFFITLVISFLILTHQGQRVSALDSELDTKNQKLKVVSSTAGQLYVLNKEILTSITNWKSRAVSGEARAWRGSKRISELENALDLKKARIAQEKAIEENRKAQAALNRSFQAAVTLDKQTRGPHSADNTNTCDSYVDAAAKEHGQDAYLMRRIIRAEGGSPTADNPTSTAYGCFQILSGTFSDPSYACTGSRYNAKDNVDCGARILKVSGTQPWISSKHRRDGRGWGD